MIDAVKEFLPPKRFGIAAYICVIVHFLSGLVFTFVTAGLRASENGRFSCSVDAKSTATYKKQVDQACFARYGQTYSPHLPSYGFILLSIALPVLVSVIYSLRVRTRVDEIESRHERQTNGEAENHGPHRKTVYVYYCYFIHLVVRVLLGIIFTVLQYTYFYPSGFNFKFSCSLPPTEVTSNINTPKNASRNMNSTSITCENATASGKWVSGIFVCVINAIVATVIIVEIIYLLPRLPIFNGRFGVVWSSDNHFVTAYFLRKRYISLEFQLTRSKCIDFYKQQVLSRSRAFDINYIQKTNLDDLYIDVVIHTERAKREFTKKLVNRHEIYDVYMKIPSKSIRLEKIRDLFYLNEDTNYKFPRTILAIGRPGIGKTVLTEKILLARANGIDEYYSDKAVFSFKFRWFNTNVEKLTDISLKTFLRFGTGLSEANFENIYEEITTEPQNAILIFDGLDEFHGNPIDFLDQSRIIPNNSNTSMSAMNLFIKLVLGDLLKGATVLVTSRPTAVDFYSKLDFDRNVEIIGFTSDKIEEYVTRFCNNNNTSDLKPKIWNHIKSSSELLNLCYIPVNCFIVCVTLSGCLSDPRNDSDALPTTLTEIYQRAIDHFEKHHQRNEGGNSTTKKASKELQRLAFLGMESGQLVFNQVLFDEQMKKSGLVNSLSDSIFPLQTQFCFIHLTIQEFLAALHVSETLAPPEIKKFISDHVGSGKWHLVLQFLAGLLGKKIKNFDAEYKNCVWAFPENLLKVTDGKIKVDYDEVFMMKCLREVDDEEITEEVCETTVLNDVVTLNTYLWGTTLSEMAALAFVCKHMKKLSNFIMKTDCLSEVLKMLQKRCLKKLYLFGKQKGTELEQVSNVLMELNCKLDHEHTELTSLRLDGFRVTTAGLSTMCNFFQNGHASQLERLHLNNNHFGDVGVGLLWDTLTKGLCKLNRLEVSHCELTSQCIPTLVKALQDERCKLTDLSLACNVIRDKGACVLFKDALANGHCKLTRLDLVQCFLKSHCIPTLVKALQNERCQLTVLSLSDNAIGDKGACMLFKDALTKKHCKLTELSLDGCSLTDQCIPSLCKALQDKHCVLTKLAIRLYNKFTENGENLLYDIMDYESCKARGLVISSALV